MRILDEKGNVLSFRDVLAYASCYKSYPVLEDYMDALEYSQESLPQVKAQGVRSYNIAKKLYNDIVSKIMSDEDIHDISLLMDIDENKKRKGVK